ncbi:MAG: phospholipase [Proteobacteria bacterium]|nr:phospholipase [Pseudomonadota bacterium]MBU1641195.1 phospholipase [Pseudomonadota bacterium]
MAILASLITAILVLWLIATLAGCRRAMPGGLSMASPLLAADRLTFLTDLTYLKEGELRCEQHILPEILSLIKTAESFIIIDIFLYNDLHDHSQNFPERSKIMTQALLAAKKRRPRLRLWIISDPVNTGYGSYPNPFFQELEAAGASVVLTNLDRLPDSNLLYAWFWHLMGKHFRGTGRGWLPSPFSPQAPRFNLGGWLALFNFKANHRKIILTEKAGLITSANSSHDASAAHSNIAFRFSGPLLVELLKSEQAVTALSGIRMEVDLPQAPASRATDTQLQLLTEGKISEALLADLHACLPPATLWMAMFYLADRKVIAALLAAARRGVAIHLILDANREAFGRQKNGVPNRPVAAWLKKKSAGRIHIRWYDSHAEQFHPKLILVASPERYLIMGGSANLTRRNIANYNLETCLRILSPPESILNQQVLSYFHRLWNNEDGEFTVAYEKYADTSLLKYWQYQFQERSGLSLF